VLGSALNGSKEIETVDVESILDEVQLALTNGIGSVLIDRLLVRFGSAAAVLSASPTELCDVPGVGLSIARSLRDPEFRNQTRLMLEFCRDTGVCVVLPSEVHFPRLLKEIPDPPNVLFVRGKIQPRDALAVAIVGTRSASQYGRTQAGRFARSLARAGLSIVSGLARGIDAAAHQGALDTEGRTIAVLSSGVSEIFPPEHEPLAGSIAATGALISEMPPGTRPKRGMFPRRNRLISGLCLATLVIEAGERSGALITARLAGEQGREVFALPGLVTSPNARGCHQLIRDGAVLVQDPLEVLEALGPLVEPVEVTPDQTLRNPAELLLNEQEITVLQAIESEPTDLNSVIATCGLPVPRVLSTLSVLEMRRLVRRSGGNMVQRV
jgi:DNA processing protein